MDSVVICDRRAEAVAIPGLGAGLASYDLIAGDRRVPLFRPCRNAAQAQPFDLAMNLLAPWSNRISGGGFVHRGAFHRLEPNLPGEPFPIHGNAFSSVWRVERAAPSRAALSLCSEGPGPFHYLARVSYELEDGALDVALSIENKASKALPYGLGLHPWLPRSQQTSLMARADRVVLEDASHLPAGEIPVGERVGWDFTTLRVLPDTWINNAFRGWDGRARIAWPDRGLRLDIMAEPPLATFIVYAPGAETDFFCFEPSTHPVDAHNLTGDDTGLIELAPADALSVRCRFSPTEQAC